MTATGIAILWRNRALRAFVPPCAAAVARALLGVTAGAAGAGEPVLAVAAVVGVVAVAGAAVVTLRART